MTPNQSAHATPLDIDTNVSVVAPQLLGPEDHPSPVSGSSGQLPNESPISPTNDKTIFVEFDKDLKEDPREWSVGKKWFTTLLASLLCLAVALGSAMPTGDLPGAGGTLGVSSIVINLSISLFVVGFGVGPLAFAPLSEIFGRQPIYLTSMFLYFIFTLPSCLAQNIETMLIGRLIAGIASSAPMCNVGGTISDIWAVPDRGLPMAVFSASIFMGPCLGPLFGGWIALKTGDWRWIYWVLFITVGVVFGLTFFMPETRAAVLLDRKAKRLNKKSNTDVYTTHHLQQREPLSSMLGTALIRPIKMMFLEPIILFMSFYLSFIYSILYALFFAFPVAFEEIRGWNMGMTGVAFVSIIIGILASAPILWVQERLYKSYCKDGPLPEGRLFPPMLGAIIMPISLFIFAFTSYPGMIWVGPCIAGILFGFSMVIVYIGANSYIVDSYSEYAASAIAAKTLMRSLMGATVPIWILPLYHNVGFQYSGLLLALVGTALGPIPFIFFFKGPSIRGRSKMTSE